MSNILHISPSYKPAFVYGGPTLSITNLCECLVKSGTSTTVFTTTANGKSELPAQSTIIEGVQVTYFPRWTGDHGHFAPALLRQVWTNCCHYDIVHIHSWWNWVAIWSVLICRIRGVRPIISPRGMLSAYSIPGRFRQLFHYSIGRWLLRGTVAHFTTEKEQREGLNYLPEWPCFTIANIVDLPVYIPAGNEEEAFTIVFIARIHPVKRLELIIEALSRVKQNFRFIIAGDGDNTYINTLKKLVDETGVKEKVSWTGWIHGDEKARLLSSANLFILTSSTENFGNAVLEALSVGTPVLLTKQIGLADYVEQQQVGWVCDDTVAALTSKLNELLSGQTEIKKLRAGIRQQIQDDFNPNVLVNQYLEQYRNLKTK